MIAEQNQTTRDTLAANLIEMGKELAGRGVRPDDFEPLAACARLYVLAWYCTDTTERSLLAPTAEDNPNLKRQASWPLEVERLRKQLAEVTAERDRLRLNLASTEFPTAAAQAQPVHDRHGAR